MNKIGKSPSKLLSYIHAYITYVTYNIYIPIITNFSVITFRNTKWMVLSYIII